MNQGQFKMDSVCYLCLAGAVVESWSLAEEVRIIFWNIIFFALNSVISMKTYRENSNW